MLISAAPLPLPVELPDAYDRHRPSATQQRAAITTVTGDHDWAGLGWGELITALLAVGRTDIPLARLVEGHVDALRILAQAGASPVPDAQYGVWASRSEQTGVRASRIGVGLALAGAVRFASGVGLIDRALVPVWLDDHTHLLVDLTLADLAIDTRQWRTSAMELSHSHTVTLADVKVPATQLVGGVDFYLSRPGFFPGGVGVAACWAGGAARVADLVVARLRPPVPDALLARLGRIRIALVTAVSTLHAAAAELDQLLPSRGTAATADWHALATEARAVVSEAVHTVLDHAERLVGPAGLAYDEDLTRAVHDLRLYVLQANADSDALLLGRTLVAKTR